MVQIINFASFNSNTWIPSLSNLKHSEAVFMLFAVCFACLATSMMEMGLFVPLVRRELNSPSVVKPSKRMSKLSKIIEDSIVL